MGNDDQAAVERLHATYGQMKQELGRVIVGQDEVVEQTLMAIFCRGHALLVGVPGLAKTLLVSTLARALDLSFKRIQFTPDLMPSDITGTDVLEVDPETGRRGFRFVHGPLFANLVLADEINRTPPKTQAALLEAMQEHHVTVGEHTLDLPKPFFVLATQNPIETEGTYPLPEAQLDRFMMKVLVDYPSENEEFVIAQRVTGAAVVVSAVASMGQLMELQQECRKVYVDPSLMQYAVKLVSATRKPQQYDLADLAKYITYGASPRATIAMIEGARALAFMRGRSYALPEDMSVLVPDVLRHRLVLSYEALSDGISADAIISKIMAKVAVPAKPLQSQADELKAA